jgi:hypothetical protein
MLASGSFHVLGESNQRFVADDSFTTQKNSKFLMRASSSRMSRHKRAPWWIFSNFRHQTTVLVAQVVVKTTVVVFPATVDRLQIPFMTKRAANNNKEK